MDSLGAPVLNPDDVRTAAAAGPRIGAVRNLGCGRSIEGSWFNVGGIQGSTITDGVGAPYSSLALGNVGLSGIDVAQFTKVMPQYGFDMSMVGGVHQLVGNAIRLGPK